MRRKRSTKRVFEPEKYDDFIRRHNKFDQHLLEELKHQDKVLVESQATEESRKAYNMWRQVASCFHRMRMFTRLEVTEQGVLFARIEPEHFVEDMVVNFFARRFPLFVIVIASRRGIFIEKKNHELIIRKKPLNIVLKELKDYFPGNELLTGLQEFDNKLWETFYDSQIIQEKQNQRYFYKNIPRKFLKAESLRYELFRVRRSKSLKEYM